MNLINDLLLKTGVLHKLSQREDAVQWFQGIRFADIMVSLIIPFLCIVAVAFFLKKRYNNKKQKEQITLSNFYPTDNYSDT